MKKEPAPRQHVWKNYFSMLLGAKLPWPLIVLCFLISLAVAQLALDFASQLEIAMGSFGHMEEAVGPLTKLFIIGMLSVLLYAGNIHLQGILGAIVDRNVQKEAIRKVFYLKTQALEEGDPRELITRLTEDTAKNSNFLIDLFVNEIPRIYYAVMFLYRICVMKQPSLIISSLLIIPVILILSMIAGKLLFGNRNQVQAKIAAVTSGLAEKIENAEIIKSYGNEEAEIASGDAIILELDKVKRKAAWVDKTNGFIKNLVWWIPVILMIVPPAILKFKGVMDTAAFFAYIMLITKFRTYVSEHLDLWTYLKEAQGATLRLSRLLSVDDECPGEKEEIPEAGNIVFDHVSFSYGDISNGEKVLDDVSFIIEKGKKTAIVGKSGSGKSTILNLIEKFYEPSEGQILLGDKKTEELGYAGYRKLFSYLPQNAPCFSGSIREALNYASSALHTDEELNEILKKVSMDQDVEELGGLEYQVGFNGEKLSGGQRQKLGIGRMLMSQRQYVLLDESTSALDAEAALALQKQIDDACEGKTQIIVAHNLSTVINADKILVMDQGKLVGEGTHEELLKTCPLYASLVKEA